MARSSSKKSPQTGSRTMRPRYTGLLPGPGPPTTPRSVLTQNRQYLEDLMTAVKKAVGQGMPVDRAVREIKLPKYRDFSSYDSWLPLNIQGAYRHIRKGK